MAVNCGALPETLLEDELFGHERGAFTSADSRRTGLIEQAEKGTLFLDEVDTLPAKAQVDLLRVLQDKKYRAIGSNREKEASVRIVAATNVPVDQLLSARAFRADLYYRLCVFLLELPPLRARKEDVPALAEHFLKKHTPPEKAELKLSASAAGGLMAWDWPGNVRELEILSFGAFIFAATALSNPPIWGCFRRIGWRLHRLPFSAAEPRSER